MGFLLNMKTTSLEENRSGCPSEWISQNQKEKKTHNPPVMMNRSIKQPKQETLDYEENNKWVPQKRY